jgi:hypothetical protein
VQSGFKDGLYPVEIAGQMLVGTITLEEDQSTEQQNSIDFLAGTTAVLKVLPDFYNLLGCFCKPLCVQLGTNSF